MRRHFDKLGTIVLILISLVSNAQRFEVDSLSEVLSRTVVDSLKIDVLNELAFHYIHTNPEIARDDVMIALKKAQEIEYIKGQSRANNVLGGINWAVGDYAVALNYYFEAIIGFEAIEDELGIAYAQNNIGEIYKKLGELEKSLEFLKLSCEKIYELGGLGKVMLSYNNLAEVYYMLGNLDKAEEYYNKILDNEELVEPKVLAYALKGLGDIYYMRDLHFSSLNYYNQSLELRRSSDDYRGLADIYLKKGQVFQKMKFYDSSRLYLDNALKESTSLEARDISLHTFLALSKLDSALGNFNNAYKNFKAYFNLKNEIYNQEKSNQIARMQTAYETELLIKENEANALKVEQRNTMIIAIFMLMILTGALAWAFYKQRRIHLKANRLLKLKHEEIISQSKKLKALNIKLEGMNGNLEEEIKSRTKVLMEQNKLLSDYSYTNAHELRAPVANILGLVNLLIQTNLSEREQDIVDHLKKSTLELDEIVSSIKYRIENKQESFKDLA